MVDWKLPNGIFRTSVSNQHACGGVMYRNGLPRTADSLAQAKVARPILVFAVLGEHDLGAPGSWGSKTAFLGGGSQKGGGGCFWAKCKNPHQDLAALLGTHQFIQYLKWRFLAIFTPPHFSANFCEIREKIPDTANYFLRK